MVTTESVSGSAGIGQILCLIFVGCLLIACTARTSSSGTAITNVTVIDAVNGVRKNQTVVFEGDGITAVEPYDADQSFEQVIDGSAKFLIPGLWDFHVHLTYNAALIDAMPELFLSYGITSVRDTGGLMHKILPVVEAMRTQDALAPRVYFSGPLLDGNYVVYDGDSRPEIGVRNASPEDARTMIAGLKAQGVDFIKIYELVSAEVFEAMVEAALEYGLPIDSHVPLALRARTAGPSVDSIEHLRNIELDCANNAAQLHETRLELLENPHNLSGFELRASLHGLQRLPAIANYDEARCDETLTTLTSTTQVPTLRLNAMALAPPYLRGDWQQALQRLPTAVRQAWQQNVLERSGSTVEADTTFADWSLFITGRMHKQGIPIGAGTDTPIGLAVPGYSLHSELEMLVRAGLSPLEAIESATVRPAEYFSITGEIGTIAAGMKADMVLLDADPLEDITNTRRISAVVSKGEILSQGHSGRR